MKRKLKEDEMDSLQYIILMYSILISSLVNIQSVSPNFIIWNISAIFKIW